MTSTTKALITVAATIGILAFSFLLTTLINNHGKKHTGSDATDDWNIGGRSLPLYVVIGTQFASAMGGGVLVGQVGNAYNNGLAMMIYSLFACLPFLIYMLIGNWIRENEFETIPDMVGSFCQDDRFVRFLASILTILVPFGWLISQMTAFAKIYREITGIPLEVLIIAIAVFSILFVMPAGMKTVAWTDFFFACFMILMMIVTLAFVVKNGGSLAEIRSLVPAEIIDMPKGFISVGWSTVFLWIFATVPGGMTNQMYFQRICAMKEKKQINKSLVISGSVTFIALIWSCYLGLGIHAMNPGLEGENATGWLLTQLPIGLIALFAGLIVATIMSTISSAAQSVVVNITHDIYQPVHPEASSQQVLKLSRMLSVLVLFIAAVLSIVYPNVLNAIVTTYAYSAAGLAAPMYLGYALRKKNMLTTMGIRASMVCGILGCVAATLLKSSVPYVIWGLVASVAALFLGSMLSKQSKVSPKE